MLASIAVLLIAVAAFGIFRSTRTLVTRRSERGRAVDPSGDIWTVLLHWTGPRAKPRLGPRLMRIDPAAVLNSSREDDSDVAANPVDEEPEERGKGSVIAEFLMNLLADGEILIIVFAVLAAVGLVIGVFALLLVIVELAVFLLLGSVLVLGRLLFRHSWVIEVVEPEGRAHFVRVVGYRNARRVEQELREAIAVGAVDIAAYGSYN